MVFKMLVGDIEFEKCGDVILSPKANIFALTCSLCHDVFLRFPDFKSHICTEHDIYLGLNDDESCESEEIETEILTATQSGCQHATVSKATKESHAHGAAVIVENQQSDLNNESTKGKEAKVTVDSQGHYGESIETENLIFETHDEAAIETTKVMNKQIEEYKNCQENHNDAAATAFDSIPSPVNEITSQNAVRILSVFDLPKINPLSSPLPADVEVQQKESMHSPNNNDQAVDNKIELQYADECAMDVDEDDSFQAVAIVAEFANNVSKKVEEKIKNIYSNLPDHQFALAEQLCEENKKDEVLKTKENISETETLTLNTQTPSSVESKVHPNRSKLEDEEKSTVEKKAAMSEIQNQADSTDIEVESAEEKPIGESIGETKTLNTSATIQMIAAQNEPAQTESVIAEERQIEEEKLPQTDLNSQSKLLETLKTIDSFDEETEKQQKSSVNICEDLKEDAGFIACDEVAGNELVLTETKQNKPSNNEENKINEESFEKMVLEESLVDAELKAIDESNTNADEELKSAVENVTKTEKQLSPTKSMEIDEENEFKAPKLMIDEEGNENMTAEAMIDQNADKNKEISIENIDEEYTAVVEHAMPGQIEVNIDSNKQVDDANVNKNSNVNGIPETSDEYDAVIDKDEENKHQSKDEAVMDNENDVETSCQGKTDENHEDNKVSIEDKDEKQLANHELEAEMDTEDKQQLTNEDKAMKPFKVNENEKDTLADQLANIENREISESDEVSIEDNHEQQVASHESEEEMDIEDEQKNANEAMKRLKGDENEKETSADQLASIENNEISENHEDSIEDNEKKDSASEEPKVIEQNDENIPSNKQIDDENITEMPVISTLRHLEVDDKIETSNENEAKVTADEPLDNENCKISEASLENRKKNGSKTFDEHLAFDTDDPENIDDDEAMNVSDELTDNTDEEEHVAAAKEIESKQNKGKNSTATALSVADVAKVQNIEEGSEAQSSADEFVFSEDAKDIEDAVQKQTLTENSETHNDEHMEASLNDETASKTTNYDQLDDENDSEQLKDAVDTKKQNEMQATIHDNDAIQVESAMENQTEVVALSSNAKKPPQKTCDEMLEKTEQSDGEECLELKSLLHDSDIEELQDVIEQLEADKNFHLTGIANSDDIDMTDVTESSPKETSQESTGTGGNIVDNENEIIQGNIGDEDTALNSALISNNERRENDASAEKKSTEEVDANKNDAPTNSVEIGETVFKEEMESSPMPKKSSRFSRLFEELEIDLDEDDDDLKELEKIMMRQEEQEGAEVDDEKLESQKDQKEKFAADGKDVKIKSKVEENEKKCAAKNEDEQNLKTGQSEAKELETKVDETKEDEETKMNDSMRLIFEADDTATMDVTTTKKENCTPSTKKRKLSSDDFASVADTPKRQKNENESFEPCELDKNPLTTPTVRVPLSPKNSALLEKLSRRLTIKKVSSQNSSTTPKKLQFENENPNGEEKALTSVKSKSRGRAPKPSERPSRLNPVVRIKRLKVEKCLSSLNAAKSIQSQIIILPNRETPKPKSKNFDEEPSCSNKAQPSLVKSKVISEANEETDDIIQDILAGVSDEHEMTTEEASKEIFGSPKESDDAILEVHRGIDEELDAAFVLEQVGLAPILNKGEFKPLVAQQFSELLKESSLFQRTPKDLNLELMSAILIELTKNTNDSIASNGGEPLKLWQIKWLINLLITKITQLMNPAKKSTRDEMQEIKQLFDFISTKRLFLCEYCAFVFNATRKFLDHMQAHKYGGQTCTYCLKTYKKQRSFELHLKNCPARH